MVPFRKVAAASVGATFLLIAIGGLVRATKSGLGCGTDWPDCQGRLLPEVANRAMMIEYSHRFVAGLIVALLAYLVLAAFKQDQPSRLRRASLAAFGLVLFQALLGAVVVVLELHSVSVVLHLGTALSLLAVLIYIALSSATQAPVVTDSSVARRVLHAAIGVFVLLLVGSYVSGADAGYVFPDWPLMDGRVVPDLAVQSKAIHFLHRALAAVVGAFVLGAVLSAAKAKEANRPAARYAHAAAGLFLIEVALGAVNVFTGGNDASVTLHLALGAAIWGLLVAAVIVTRPPSVLSAELARTAPAGREAA